MNSENCRFFQNYWSVVYENEKKLFYFRYISEKKYCHKRLFYIFQRVIRIKIIALASNSFDFSTLEQPSQDLYTLQITIFAVIDAKVFELISQFIQLSNSFSHANIANCNHLIFTQKCNKIKLIKQEVHSDNNQAVIRAVV